MIHALDRRQARASVLGRGWGGVAGCRLMAACGLLFCPHGRKSVALHSCPSRNAPSSLLILRVSSKDRRMLLIVTKDGPQMPVFSPDESLRGLLHPSPGRADSRQQEVRVPRVEHACQELALRSWTFNGRSWPTVPQPGPLAQGRPGGNWRACAVGIPL